jgi:hypothetical protein
MIIIQVTVHLEINLEINLVTGLEIDLVQEVIIQVKNLEVVDITLNREVTTLTTDQLEVNTLKNLEVVDTTLNSQVITLIIDQLEVKNLLAFILDKEVNILVVAAVDITLKAHAQKMYTQEAVINL